MKITTKENTKTIRVTPTCTAIEYPNGDSEIWGSVIEINGRYPEVGFTVNEICKELVYFLKGEGKVVVNNHTYDVKEGDQLVIDPGEKFYWEGNLVLFMPCTPAWYPEQHKEAN